MTTSRMREILIIKIYAIGDVLCATPAFRAVRRAFPDARITCLVGAWSDPALEGNPDVDERIVVPDRIFFERDWPRLLALAIRLRRRRFDAVLLFHRVPEMHLFARAAGGVIRAGWSVAPRSPHLTHAVRPVGRGGHLVKEGLRLAEAVGAPSAGTGLTLVLSDAERRGARRILAESGRLDGAPVVLLAPGGGRNPRGEIREKIWTPEGFARAARHARERLHASVFLIGAKSDRERNAEVLRLARLDGTGSGAVDLAGKTSLREMMALIGEARLLVTNDSAPLHVAAALDTPVVSVFGPTDAAALAPESPRAIAIQSPVPCSPCYWGVVRDFIPCTPTICMTSLAAEPVLAAMDRLWETTRTGETAGTRERANPGGSAEGGEGAR